MKKKYLPAPKLDYEEENQKMNQNANPSHLNRNKQVSSNSLWVLLGCGLIIVISIAYISTTVILVKSINQNEKLSQTILDETKIIQKKNKKIEENLKILNKAIKAESINFEKALKRSVDSKKQGKERSSLKEQKVDGFDETEEDIEEYGKNGLTAQAKHQDGNKNLQIIDMLGENDEGQTIEQYLYRDDSIIDKRKKYQTQRIDFLAKKNFQSLALVQFNMKLNHQRDQDQAQLSQAEYTRLDKKYHFDDYKTELPMCIINPGYNNNANFRIEYGLNSIFTQNYTNYFAVVINDASNDGSDQIYQRYFEFHKISKSKYIYINNKKRLTALENIYNSFTKFCSKDAVALTLDADDQFIGRNVLKVLNTVYQKQKAGVVYSNFYWFGQSSETIRYGFTSEFTDEQKKKGKFRSAPQRFSHLRSFRVEVALHVDPKDLKDDNGKFHTITYDFVLFYPMFEISCGRVKWIDEFQYLYNVGTGLNDYQTDQRRQVELGNKVRSSPPRQCWKEFDEKMSKM